mgnify:CR=1 FL=1
MITLNVSDEVLAQRRANMEAKGKDVWKAIGRVRPLTMPLKTTPCWPPRNRELLDSIID